MGDIMFKRKAYEFLLDWKNTADHKPLIIKGLRQTGKTTLVEQFAKENYESVIMLDFRKEQSLHSIFEKDFIIDDIMFEISTKRRGVKIIPHNTIIIMDEIQDCPDARSSLKYFALDGRYDVICTGSLLGVKGYRKTKKKNRGISVGFEEHYEMKPMDFEEFLWANGVEENIIKKLNDYLINKKQIPNSIHEMMSELFKKYIIIGGMPEVVKKFVETNDYYKARAVQKRIVNDYNSDFGTHLNDELELEIDPYAKVKIFEIFNSIPRQLAKENKKFQYSVIAKNAKSREYKDALNWLVDYGLIVKCYNISNIEIPLEYFAIDDNFKIYIADSGLFISMLDDDAPGNIMDGNYNICKGAIFENIIADSFSKKCRDLYFYQKSSGLEIDFITTLNKKVCLVEVKAVSGNSKSSSTILNNYELYKVDQLVKITSKNIGFIDNKLTIPHYLTFLLF